MHEIEYISPIEYPPTHPPPPPPPLLTASFCRCDGGVIGWLSICVAGMGTGETTWAAATPEEAAEAAGAGEEGDYPGKTAPPENTE